MDQTNKTKFRIHAKFKQIRCTVFLESKYEKMKAIVLTGCILKRWGRRSHIINWPYPKQSR